MRKGFTTGTAASAAAKAHAVYIQTGTAPESVDIMLPSGDELTIPVHLCGEDGACIIKDAGDDPDITHGAEIWAFVNPDGSGVIKVTGGKGIGTVTKAGLQVGIGSPAINPVPMQMIKSSVAQTGLTSCTVTISVPKGEELAKETFNSRIGIVGGISIIGTTGIVEPMSIEALTATIACEIDVQAENGAEHIYLVPGKIGEKHLHRLIPDAHGVIMSNYAGFAIEHALKKGIKSITLAGHPGKLAKIAMGFYNTHSKHSPMAQDYIARLLELKGEFNTVEEICAIAQMDAVAEAIGAKILADHPLEHVSVILFDMGGELKGRRDG
ncbi:MAG: cobalt-precorrin-5B (C(1))-methyltransferase CbiD [Deferribacterales bacterium]